ncbi:MAG: carboxypeptidase regulatory-like domain-containing protein [Gammaproteobacteria bacterium]|nr:carboxypeptidase regulatory-like domain-containing protein [Gammaproteobacteria bacterium]
MPTVSITAAPETISKGESTTLYWNTTNAVGGVYIDNGGGFAGESGSVAVSPEHSIVYTITATGAEGTASAQVLVTVTNTPTPPPEGTFADDYKDQIPSDATIEEYEEKRFSLITGQVNDDAGTPLPDVLITIYSHPQYGTAKTDAEGKFSIPVEGGGTIKVIFKKQGFITSHRQAARPVE